MKRVSSILFALSIFGGVAYADSDYTEVRAELTFDRSLLQEEGGAQLVLKDLEKQAEKACRKVSMISVGLVVDKVCAQDVLFQAVEQIDSDKLSTQYAGSSYFVETTSARLQMAAR